MFELFEYTFPQQAHVNKNIEFGYSLCIDNQQEYLISYIFH